MTVPLHVGSTPEGNYSIVRHADICQQAKKNEKSKVSPRDCIRAKNGIKPTNILQRTSHKRDAQILKTYMYIFKNLILDESCRFSKF